MSGWLWRGWVIIREVPVLEICASMSRLSLLEPQFLFKKKKQNWKFSGGLPEHHYLTQNIWLDADFWNWLQDFYKIRKAVCNQVMLSMLFTFPFRDIIFVNIYLPII